MISLSFLLIFPLFFQLNGTIFNDSGYVFDSIGDLNRIPIPISVLAYIVGFLILRKEKVTKEILFFVFTIPAIIITTQILSTNINLVFKYSNFSHIIQFVFPIFSIALGHKYGSIEKNCKIFEKTGLFIVFSIIPIQLAATFISGVPVLSPSLFFFSIYQHLQYVPSILICVYIYGLFSVWNQKNFRHAFIISAPILGIYAQFSLSLLTNFYLVSGLVLFAIYRWAKFSEKLALVLSFIVITFSIGTLFVFKENQNFLQKYSFGKSSLSQSLKKESKNILHSNLKGSNISDRIRIWKYYIKGIAADKKKFLFGNPELPERSLFPSAHNYYLDLTYNYGVVSLAPIIFMLCLTFKRVINLNKASFKNSSLVGLILVTFYLVIIDNMFKVGMKQPYPGIMTFFLWGLLISRLNLKKVAIHA